MHTRMDLRTYLSNNGVEHQLRRIFSYMAKSAKYISFDIQQSHRGKAGSKNQFGEEQMALDVLTDQMIIDRLKQETSFGIRELASEEQDSILSLKPSSMSAGEPEYSITIDPLDGSSLIDVNLSIGTIVGVHEGDILDGKPGREKLKGAMAFVYGPQTTMLCSAGNGVQEFLLDPAGNWVLLQDNIKLDDKGKLYSMGGLRRDWTPKHANFVEALEDEKYKLRYSGALVADLNQLLLKRGGVFSYPALNKSPNGKLRLLMELQPFAFIFEQAGGRATDGLEDILDKVPRELDERSPIYIGSKYEVDLAEEYLKGNLPSNS